MTQTEPLFFNPFDPDFRVDPYPTLTRFREEEPWHLSALGPVVLSRFEDCVALLRHPNASSAGDRSPDANNPVSRMQEAGMDDMRPFLFMDPPDHSRLRGLVNKAFTPRTVENLRPRVHEIVDELVDAALERGSIELIEDLAYLLPVQIISEMLGVPTEDHERFKGWSRVLAKSLDPELMTPPEVMAQRQEASTAFTEYFRGLIAERRATPRDDLLSALVAVEDEGEVLSEPELLATLILLLVAGHETTVNLIGNGMYALCRQPDAAAAWRADASLARTAVEELLRFDPPVQFTGRMARDAAIELPSGTLQQGEFAIMLLAAANRDPRQFSDPDRLDLARADNRHMAFGFGIHHCLGAPLARIEGQIALGTLLARTTSIELTVDQPEYKENIVLRGLAALPLSLLRA